MAFIGLGVSGGIGAYKAVEVARLLQKRGHRVQAVMTRTARRFVGPLTFEAITRERVITSQFEPGMNAEIEHISLASDMSLLLVAPATANIIAHENVLKRLSMDPPAGQQAVPFGDFPTETFFGDKREFLFNGEAVQIIHEPDAHTDGDSLVFFRRSDVVATGDLFTTVMYPFIDTANGGTMNGYIKALNAILDITVPNNVNEGGTMVVPGHGRLSDEQDVIEYRDMATIVRDRIREYVKRGMTLEQVKAKKPTLDFDPRYGSDTGFWTTSMFVETIYKEMVKENPPAPAKGNQRNRNQSKGSGA